MFSHKCPFKRGKVYYFLKYCFLTASISSSIWLLSDLWIKFTRLYISFRERIKYAIKKTMNVISTFINKEVIHGNTV